MKVIERPRNGGKTTILLHYMVVNPDSLYVSKTENSANRAFKQAQKLGLKIDIGRFVGAVNPKIEKWNEYGDVILVDDADNIVKYHPSIGYNLIAKADIITITKGETK